MATQQRPISHYDLLGVPPTATLDEIRAAYHARIAAHHPDRNRSPHANAIAALLNEAWAVLRDPEKRRRYDATLASGKFDSPQPPNRAADKTGRQNDARPSAPPPPNSQKREPSSRQHEPDMSGQAVPPTGRSPDFWPMAGITVLGLVAAVSVFALATNGYPFVAIAGAVIFAATFFTLKAPFLKWKYKRYGDPSRPRSWQCARCDRQVPGYIDQCRCGYTRPIPKKRTRREIAFDLAGRLIVMGLIALFQFLHGNGVDVGTAVLIIIAVIIGIPLLLAGLWLGRAYWLVAVGYFVAGWFGAFVGLVAVLVLRAIDGSKRSGAAASA